MKLQVPESSIGASDNADCFKHLILTVRIAIHLWHKWCEAGWVALHARYQTINRHLYLTSLTIALYCTTVSPYNRSYKIKLSPSHCFEHILWDGGTCIEWSFKHSRKTTKTPKYSTNRSSPTSLLFQTSPRCFQMKVHTYHMWTHPKLCQQFDLTSRVWLEREHPTDASKIHCYSTIALAAFNVQAQIHVWNL